MTYRRILLKLSGEALAGERGQGLDPAVLQALVEDLKILVTRGVQLALVVGAGNFFRGLSSRGRQMQRVTADYIGMLGTVMNSLAVADFLQQAGVPAVVMSAIEMPRLCELVQPLRAVKLLENGTVVLFAGGTGNPYFTTDSTAALRAAEIGADAVFKATKVDGVYSSDPKRDPHAQRFDTITYEDVLLRNLQVMDLTAITLCNENRLPIVVFNMTIPGNIVRVIEGQAICTRVIPTTFS
ncbi:MAG: UMP kinase [bacterium]|nr:UMP kinase [bacterium]